MNGWVKHFNFTDCCWREQGCVPPLEELTLALVHGNCSIFQDSDNIPNSAGCFWHYFCRKRLLWASSLVPRAAGAAAWDTRGGEELKKPTWGQKLQQDKEKSGCLEMTSLLLHLEGFLEYFPPFFFALMRCNYANEVALIITHLQHPWRLLGARGSSPAGSSGREGTGGHCTPRGTCAFGYLDQQKSLVLNCSETTAPSPH